MKNRLGWLVACLTAVVAVGSWGASTAQAADNCTATFTSGTEGTFPGTFKYDNSTKVLTVDLSGVPRDAVIFRAELILNGLQQFQVRPMTPTKVLAEGNPDKPLKLIGPRFVSLDALDAVKAAVAAGKPLTLKLECTLSGARRLEVSYVGGKSKAEAVPTVSNVKVLHRAGQSLVVFTEPKLPWIAAIPAPFDGTMASVAVDAGQTVKKGDVLAKMDTAELTLQLEAAKADQIALQKQMDLAKTESPPAAAKVNDLKTKLDKAAATIKTVEDKLAKVELKSPVSGKVVGDPTQKKSAAVKAGQTVVEVAGELDPADYPTLKLGADVSRVKQEVVKRNPGVTFRIWRSGERITPATVAKAELVGECGFFTGWNSGYHQDGTGGNPPIRYRVTDGGDEVPWGTGIYAHNPPKPAGPLSGAGKAFYAVTVAVNGEEDLSKLTDANTTAEAVEETVGQGVPVLQWKEVVKEFNYRAAPNGNIIRLIYTRWEAWPNSSTPNNPIDYLMACSDEPMPEKMPTRELHRLAFRTDPAQAALHLHCWGANLNGGYYWWYNAHRGAVLLASNQIPYDWWTGFHEANGTCKTFGDGFVHPFTMTRLFSFLDWAARQHAEAPEAIRAYWPKLDLTKTFVTGMSMGGAGAPMYPIRFADRIALGQGMVGVHIPAESPQFAGSYEGSYGPRNPAITMPDGKTSPWDYFSDEWYLRNNIKAETGLVIASNGKNDGGIGWPQAYKFARALQETRRPHVFNWGMGGHLTGPLSQFTELDARTNLSLPAFTNGTLDDDIGQCKPRTKEEMDAEKAVQDEEIKAGKRRKGEYSICPFDGKPSGAFNGHLWWETADLVDKPDAWELTAVLMPSAPKAECKVDLTPRRLQQFKTPKGAKFAYTVTDVQENKELAKGEATADELDLLTLKQIPLVKGKNRIKITPAK